jgi:aryl-alcohol dehydrogenase-like predicted oxidoreductase
MPRFYKENFYKNIDLIDNLNEVVNAKGVSSSELVLAWVMAQGPDIFSIPG